MGRQGESSGQASASRNRDRNNGGRMFTGLHTLFSYSNLTHLTVGGTAQSRLDLPTSINNFKKYMPPLTVSQAPSEGGSYSVD